MRPREMHPFVSHLFTLIKDEKLEPNDRLEQVSATLQIIKDSRQKDLELYQKLKKLSPVAPEEIKQDEQLKILYSLDDAENDSDSLLTMAIKKQMTPIVKLLLENGAKAGFCNPKDNETPLNLAILTGNIEMIQLLLKAGADPNFHNPKSGDTPLIVAASLGIIEIVNILLAAGADINKPNPKEYNLTPIINAAKYGHAELMKLLIEKKADFQLKDVWHERTPIHYAAINGREKCIEVLLSVKVAADTPDRDGTTPLYLASENGHTEAIITLIDAGADPNAKNKTDFENETALYRACHMGHLNAVSTLLDKKANPNIDTRHGLPLLIAAHRGNLEIISKLLEAKANINKPSGGYRAKSALEDITVTWDRSNPSVISLLLSHQASVFNPNQLHSYLMHQDQRKPGVLESLRLLCAQQRTLREQKNNANPIPLLSDDVLKDTELYVQKLTELTQIFETEEKEKMKAEMAKGIAETKITLSPSLLNIVADYHTPPSPLAHLSIFKPEDIDQRLTEARSKQKPKQ